MLLYQFKTSANFEILVKNSTNALDVEVVANGVPKYHAAFKLFYKGVPFFSEVLPTMTMKAIDTQKVAYPANFDIKQVTTKDFATSYVYGQASQSEADSYLKTILTCNQKFTIHSSTDVFWSITKSVDNKTAEYVFYNASESKRKITAQVGFSNVPFLIEPGQTLHKVYSIIPVQPTCYISLVVQDKYKNISYFQLPEESKLNCIPVVNGKVLLESITVNDKFDWVNQKLLPRFKTTLVIVMDVRKPGFYFKCEKTGQMFNYDSDEFKKYLIKFINNGKISGVFEYRITYCKKLKCIVVPVSTLDYEVCSDSD